MEIRVIIPNLVRRSDRKNAVMGALCSRGIRRDYITFFEAHDAMLYGSNCQVFFEDIKADGFDFFDTYAADAARNNWHHVDLGYIATQWSIVGCFRHIAKQPEPHLFLLDDWYLTISYTVLYDLVGELIRHENLKCLQLNHYIRQQVQPREPHLIHPHSFVSKKLLGCGECALILTPDGAQFLLDNCPLPDYNYEMMFGIMDEYTDGFFSCVNPIALRFHDCPDEHQNAHDWKRIYGHEFGW